MVLEWSNDEWPPWAGCDEVGYSGLQPYEGWIPQTVPPWEEDGDYFLRETGYFTPTIDSDEEEEAPPPSCVHSVLKEMPKPQPLSPETLRRISANRAAALKRKYACEAIAIALKEKQPHLLNDAIRRAEVRTRLGMDAQSRQQLVDSVQWHPTNTFEMLMHAGKAKAYIWRPSIVERALVESSDIQTPAETRSRLAVEWLQLQPKCGLSDKMLVDESDEEIGYDLTPPPKFPKRVTERPLNETIELMIPNPAKFTSPNKENRPRHVLLSSLPPPSCVPIQSVLKEMPKPQPLSPETLRRISANRAAALKRKQELDVDMTDFTPRCRKKREISEHAENLEHDLTTGKPPVHPASKQQSTAPQIPNCNCIQCAGVLAKPIVAKCVICDEPVIYSICAMHYPNTLQFHIEVQNHSRSIICFKCKSAI